MHSIPSHRASSHRTRRRPFDSQSTTRSRIEALRISLGLVADTGAPGLQRQVPPAPSVFPGPLTRPHVLLIDPCLEVLEQMGHVLGCQGFGVTCSSTILDARCVAQLVPDVIVLNADVESAATSLGFLRAGLVRTGLGIPPIIHATSSPELAESLVESEMITLAAPYSPDGLLRLIDTVLTVTTNSQAPGAPGPLHREGQPGMTGA